LLEEEEDAAAPEQPPRWCSGNVVAVQAKRTASVQWNIGAGCSKKKKMQWCRNNLLDGAGRTNVGAQWNIGMLVLVARRRRRRCSKNVVAAVKRFWDF